MSGRSKVWLKFSTKNSAGTVFNLSIVDFPKDRYGDLIDSWMNYFVKEEATFRASGISTSEEALAEIREDVLKRANDESFHTVVCCLDNNDDVNQDIIGASRMMYVKPEEISEKMLHGNAAPLKKKSEIYGGMLSSYDIVKEFNLDRYFVDRGLFVNPDNRGLGIAQELFKVRRMICKEYGVPIHGSWMTAYGTQKAAERDGWETVHEINCNEYGKKHGVTFENVPPSFKFMITRISL